MLQRQFDSIYIYLIQLSVYIMYVYIYLHPNILQILRIKSVDTQINKTIKSKQPTHRDTNITPVFWHLLVEGCCSIGVSNMPIDLKDAAMLEGSYQRWAEDSGDETKVTALTWEIGYTKVCWLMLMLHVHQPEIPSHCTKIPKNYHELWMILEAYEGFTRSELGWFSHQCQRFITKTTAIWYSKANSERVTLPQTQSKCLTKKDHHKIKIIMQQRTDRMWHPPYFSGQKSWNSLNRMALFEETHGFGVGVTIPMVVKWGESRIYGPKMGKHKEGLPSEEKSLPIWYPGK